MFAFASNMYTGGALLKSLRVTLMELNLAGIKFCGSLYPQSFNIFVGADGIFQSILQILGINDTE